MLTFDGKPTDARFEEQIYPIARQVARTEVEKTVEVVLLRRKQKMTMQLTTVALGQAVGDDFEAEAWGLTVKEITPSMARMLALDHDRGVLATGALSESAAAKAGIGNRDVLVAVGATEIEDLEHFKQVYEKLSQGEAKKVVLKIMKGGRTPRLAVLDLKKAKTGEGSGK